MTADPRLSIAPSVSPEARAIMAPFGEMVASLPRRPDPVTLAEFDDRARAGADLMTAFTAEAVSALSPATEWSEHGGVPTLTVTPRGWEEDGTRLVYVHGGGFIQGSARSCLLMAALMADRTHRRVLSLDYTLAPRARFGTITDQVAAAWTSIAADRDPSAIGLFGESAGGAIAAATVHKLRDRGSPPPAALLLISPVADLTGSGDTFGTLAPYDFLAASLKHVAYNAYADADDHCHPYASPLFGDFTAFPPTMIQTGTREMLLSDSVRLARAIRASGGDVVLDLYDGMPHVFEQMVPDAPEGRQAWDEIARFWRTRLGGR